MPSPTPTLRDLAAHVGLSVTTVSDALRGSGRVSSSTRERVARAAAELGYFPNRNARALRARAKRYVGLFIPRRIRMQEFYMPFALALADALSSSSYELVVIGDGGGGKGQSWREFAAVVAVDATLEDPLFAANVSSEVPLVTAGRIEGVAADRVSAVVEIDYAALMRQALNALQKLTSFDRSILVGYAPGDRFSWSRQLVEEYQRWTEERAVDAHVVLIDPAVQIHGVPEGLLPARWLPDGVGAVLFGGPMLALAGSAALRESDRDGAGRAFSASVVTSELEAALVPTDVVLDIRAREFGACVGQVCADFLTSGTQPVHEWIEPRVFVKESRSK